MSGTRPKRTRLETEAEAPLLNVEDWQQLGVRYKKHDETRESVIKRCRDMQKLSKNAIFALHRGDVSSASSLIDKAEALAKEMLPTVIAAPSLRQGSFGNACEEYAEALIFQVYLKEGRVLPWCEASWLTCEEYLGGVLDFTGELGRLAVAKATERHVSSVMTYKVLLEDLSAKFTVLDLRHPGLRRKMGPLEATLSKVQRLVYELSLSQQSALMSARLQVAEPEVAVGSKAEEED